MPRTAPANPLFLRDQAIDLQFELWLLASAGIQRSAVQILSEHDLDLFDFMAISLIARHDAVTMALLVDLTGRPKQVVSRRLLLLEQRALILRLSDPSDRRRKLLQLSDRGNELHERTMDKIRRHLRRAFSATGSQTVEGFAEVLRGLAEPAMLRSFGMERSPLVR